MSQYEQLISDSFPVPLAQLERLMEVTGIQGNAILGHIREPMRQNSAGLRQLFKSEGLVAFLERTSDGHVVTYGPAPRQHKPKLWVNAVLFIATVGTTLVVGSFQQGGNPFRNPADLVLGIPFSLGIILVLGSHELAHYLAARRYGVEATPPYFLPVPHPMTGTMGAFIRITSPVPTKSALVRVGVAGPLVGFLVSLPVTVFGLALSKPIGVGSTQGIQLGSPLVFSLLSKLLHPTYGPDIDLLLHPLAFAGWLGMFVTALNLLPIGQLDGGHIAYSVFGRRWTRLSLIVVAGLLLMGFFWLGWPFWAVVTVLLGLRHPRPLDDVTPLDRTDLILAIAALVLMVLTFTPAPFGAARL